MATVLAFPPLEALALQPVESFDATLKFSEVSEITGVFRGRELTRKDRRLASGITPLDGLIGGGIVRGRISEIVGDCGSGRMSLAASFLAETTRRGEIAAWLDAAGGFDPASIAAAGVDLARLLWAAAEASPPLARISRNFAQRTDSRCQPATTMLKAAEWLMAAGGFGLVVLDFGEAAWAPAQSAALRLAHCAERSGGAVLVLAAHRMFGTFAALTLKIVRRRAYFGRSSIGAPALFDGIAAEARVTRNKLGGAGGVARWRALIDPSSSPAGTSADAQGTPPIARLRAGTR